MERDQPGVAHAGHLAVQDDVLFLHPPIMAARNDLVVARQYRADRQAAFGDAGLRLADRLRHEIEMIGLNGHNQCPCCDLGVVLPTSVGRAISASNISMIRASASSSVQALSLA